MLCWIWDCVSAELYAVAAGQGGGDRHWGPWYTGAPMTPFNQVCPYA